jgi:anhydro-N-acetylmuramic acid kinase
MSIKDLYKLSQKKEKMVIGLMSGTSLDGVDAVLVKISGSGVKTKIDQLKFISFPFPAGLKEKLLENSSPGSGNVSDICRLNFLIAQIYADAVNMLLRKAKVNISSIDLIGSHGQTIHHLPNKEKYFNYNVASTLQIGDPSVIAKLTGITTIGDFRTGDVALGGQGAPLVPYFDYVMFHSPTVNRALLNIGGISNITILSKNGKSSDVIAFDTGPGNMLIDLFAKKYFKVEYDKEGKIASSGTFNEELFNHLAAKDKYIKIKPPKSTGREYYGKYFLNELENKFNQISKEDFLNTLTVYSAYAVYKNYDLFIKAECEVQELFVSGGGARNKFLIRHLKKYFGSKVKVKNVASLGISSDAKEAVCFALLANETLSGNPSNIPRVTGASKPTILGKISFP